MKKLMIFVFAVFFSSNIFSQENQNNLLSSVQEKYNSLSSLSANFNQALNGITKLTGKVYFAKGNKIRIELKNSTIISDGSTFWNYNKKQNKVVINNYDENDPSSFSINKIIFDYPSKCEVTDESGVITLIPKIKSDLDFSKAQLWVNDNNLVEKVLIEDPSRGKIEFTLSIYKINQRISDNMFTLLPPEGTKIIDLR
ncbi:MAG: outer membrane lipoprotein carrier protein LolA [Ignavibacteriaceae bacterium]